MTSFEIAGIRGELEDFAISLERIDPESVKERTLLRVAEEASEMVRQAVIAEDDITSPALNSAYERGPGPSMASRAAWIVEKDGADRYTVTPHPRVRQRAIVLNYGYPGTIEPVSADYLRFTVNGVPMYRKSVEGPDATGYWQAAFRRLEKSGRVEDIATEELEDEGDSV